MGAFRDLSNQRFGRLTAISHEFKPTSGKSKRTIWTCICDCGNTKKVSSTHLVQNATQSCGCIHSEQLRDRQKTHGMTHTRFYSIWQNMCSRSKPNHLYSKRGITMCPEWLSFEKFKGDMYESYEAHVELHGEIDTSIDRIDNNKGYHLDNCRWATKAEQSSNTSRSKRYSIMGERLTMTEIATKYRIPKETVFYRLKRKWPLDKVIQKFAGYEK